MTDRYEKAARIYCEEMGLDADEREVFRQSNGKVRESIRWLRVADEIRHEFAMNRALKAVEE